VATADLIIRVITDTSKAKGLDETAGKFGKFGAGVKKLAVPAGVALAGIVAFGAGAVKAASDVQQSLGAVDAVFGKNSASIKKWADQAATSVGISKNSYMELASVTGAQLKNMGLPMDKVTGQTNDLIKKGADLAAQFGGSTKDAVEAIGSALRGETDPIERYGVSIKQADIAAQQAAEGTDKLTGAAGKQAKTMALLHLLNKQTADSTGAFARENDSAAHQAQVAQAQYEDMQATLGQALLPAVTKVMGVLADLAALLAKHKTTTQIAIAAIAAMAVAVLALNVAMTVYTAVTTLAGSATLMAWAAVLGPILLVVAAVALVVAGIVILWKRSSTFRTIVMAVWHAIQAGAKATGRAIVAAWNAAAAGVRALAGVVRSVFSGIRSVAQAVGNTVRTIWRLVFAGLSAYVRAYLAIFRAVFNAIRSVASAVASRVREIFSSIRDAAGDAASAISSRWSSLMAGLRGMAAGVGAALSAPFNAVRGAINALISAVQSLIGWLGRIHVPKISLPHIPGVSSAGAAAGFSTAAVAGRSAAPAVATTSSRASTGGGGGIVINVTGALDPEATARQIQRILGGHQRRVGLRVS